MESLEGIAPFLAGPGAAVIVLLAVFGALYKLTVQYGIPLVSATVNRHMEELERANKRHSDSVQAHLAHIREMGARYERLSHEQSAEHKQIFDAIEEVSRKLKVVH